MAKTNPAKGMSTDLPVPAKPERDYEAENAHDTLSRAHEIMNDDKLMPRVRKIAGRKAKSASALNDMVAEKETKPTINTLADVKAAGKAMAMKKRMG